MLCISRNEPHCLKHTYLSEVPVCQSDFCLPDTVGLSGNRREKKNLFNLCINCQWCFIRIFTPEESHNLHENLLILVKL